MRLYGNDPFGVIYRTEDAGDSWELVHEFPGGIVYDLTETPRGDLLAATGWNGLVFRSTDGGRTWVQASPLAQDITMTCIIAIRDQVFIGTDAQRGGGVFVAPDQTILNWSQTQGWAGEFLTVHDLVSTDGSLFAAVTGKGQAGVYRSDAAGMVWLPSGVLPDSGIAGARSLAVEPTGGILAGTEMIPGVSSAFVCRSEDGESWEVLGGPLELANRVYALQIEGERRISAATGYVYGKIFRYDPTISGMSPEDGGIPREFALEQNYPNPFNPSTSISYGLPVRSAVRLAVFDVLGREIAVLVQGEQAAGRYRVSWQPQLASGVYLCRIDARPVGDARGRFVEERKMILVR
jgi:hypothetical protein